MTQATRACDRCGKDISALHYAARRCKTCPKRLTLGVLPDRACEICGKIYTPKRRDSLCCSRPCNGLRYNRLRAAQQKAAEPERTCPACKTTFKARRTDQVYCIPECGNRHRARRAYVYVDLSPRPCAWCSKVFTPKQSTSTLCSRLCSRRSTYAKYRKERVAKAVAWARANPELRAAIATQNKARRRFWEQTNPGSVGVTPKDWLKLVRRYGHRCAYCGGNTGGIHMDHVIPMSRGGRHAIGNVLPACQTCNLSKGPKLVAEWKRR
ncbi:HNH endonuclease [Streptomyces antimycoticus]|uniref:HNH endonuclease n=1 Tax=Streptomyces antimycoticus TaxID=68175 RepID=UPI00386508BC|nr:HNH endonuclease [Streptomyces antimycoticus]